MHPFFKLDGGVYPLPAQDKIAAGEFNDSRHILARTYRYLHERQVDAQHPVFIFLKSHAFTFERCIPIKKLDDEIYLFLVDNGRYSEEMPDIHDPDAPVSQAGF